VKDDYLLSAYRYLVTLTQVTPQGKDPAVLNTEGGFAECSGLELEADVRDYLEGGRNDGVVRRVGRVKLSPIVLKRGMFSASRDDPANTDLWTWLTRMVSGELPVSRYDGRVQILEPSRRTVLATWSFDRGLPKKVAGPTLNGRTGEIALEELHIVHEGLRMEPPR
jgi:phage tail-like protein